MQKKKTKNSVVDCKASENVCGDHNCLLMMSLAALTAAGTPDIATSLTQALSMLVPCRTERSLSVNMDKTHTMLIHPKGTPSAQMEVPFNGLTLTPVLS